MTDDKEPDGHDPDFAVGDAGQALFRVWAELNDALPWITMLADADDSGQAGIVEEHIEHLAFMLIHTLPCRRSSSIRQG